MAVLAIAAVGAVAGGVVGAGFGAVALGASIGWMVGSFIGQLAFGPDPPSQEGPRLTDLNVQSSAEGVGIPIVFGRARIAGNVIWGRPIQETRHEEEVGGKGMGGGGTQVSYTYSVSFAIGICEGPIIGVRKIWADSKLIYDVSASASAGTLQVSQELAKAIRVYTGSESQTADPTIQSFEGAANSPAYRGLAYLVFEDLQLADFANHMPNVTVEVLTAGSVQRLRLLSSVVITPDYLGETGYTTKPDLPLLGQGIYQLSSPDNDKVLRLYTSVNPTLAPDCLKPTNGTAFRDTYDLAGNFLGRAKWSYPLMQGQIDWPGDASFHLIGYLGDLPVWWNSPAPGGFSVNGVYLTGTWLDHPGSADPLGYETCRAAGVSSDGGKLFHWVEKKIAEPNVYEIRLRVYGHGLTLLHDGVDAVVMPHTPGQVIGFCMENGSRYLWYEDGAGNLKLYYIEDNYALTLAESIPWDNSASFADWMSARDGLMCAEGNNLSPIQFRLWSRIPVYIPTTVTLASVVSALATRTGLVAGDLDMTALTDTIDGYVIPRPMTARAALEQLRQAYFFDGVESDGKIKFVKRGGASAATIASDDLGAREYGSFATSGEAQEPIRTTRAQELELPAEVCAVPRSGQRLSSRQPRGAAADHE